MLLMSDAWRIFMRGVWWRRKHIFMRYEILRSILGMGTVAKMRLVLDVNQTESCGSNITAELSLYEIDM